MKVKIRQERVGVTYWRSEGKEDIVQVADGVQVEWIGYSNNTLTVTTAKKHHVTRERYGIQIEKEVKE